MGSNPPTGPPAADPTTSPVFRVLAAGTGASPGCYRG